MKIEGWAGRGKWYVGELEKEEDEQPEFEEKDQKNGEYLFYM